MPSDLGDREPRGPHGTLIAEVPAHQAPTIIAPSGSQDSRPSHAPAQPSPAASRRAAPPHVLVKLLGKGGMGEVYAAFDPELRRNVAFKRLLPELVDDAGMAARFLTEVQVTAQLDHPNIVPVNGFELAEDATLGYSMKLIKGRDLSKLVDKWRGEAATLDRANAARRLASRLDIFLRICEAMIYAHGKGVLHRDLKPENVMVGLYNDVYVMDWGIFRLIGDPSPEDRVSMDERAAEIAGHGQTRDGMVLGTPAYMSPEQAAGKVTALDQRSDVFTLGVILAELITLRPARPTATLDEALAVARRGELAPLVSANPRHPIARELRAIVARATQLDAAARYPTVRELADDLRRMLRGEAVQAGPDNPLQALARRLARHRMIALVTILGLIAVGGAAVAWQIRARSAAEEATLRRHSRHQLLAAAAARQVHRLEVDLARWEVAAARLVGRVSEAMATVDAVDPSTALYFGAAYDRGEGPPDLAPSRRYRRAISVDQPVVQLAPGVSASGAVQQAALRVAGLRRQLQNALLATAPEATMALSDDAARALLLGDGVPALRAFVTLANGVHVSYPGYGGYEANYDGRARKKYTSTLAIATGVARVHWGEIFEDRHGLGPVLPLGCVLLDRGDQVAGAAGLELSLAWIADQRLVIADAPWADEYLLLDAQGRVLVRVAAGGAPSFPTATAPGEAGELRLVAFTHEQARRAAVAAEAGVLELPDGRIAAVAPLSTIDFTLVVVADPRRMATP